MLTKELLRTWNSRTSVFCGVARWPVKTQDLRFICHEMPMPTEVPQETSVSNVQHPRSHLFMVRVWLEDLGDGKIEWRGQVKHVSSGEVRYFREWPVLLDHLQAMLHLPLLTADETNQRG